MTDGEMSREEVGRMTLQDLRLLAMKTAPLEMGGKCEGPQDLISEWKRQREEANSWQSI